MLRLYAPILTVLLSTILFPKLNIIAIDDKKQYNTQYRYKFEVYMLLLRTLPVLYSISFSRLVPLPRHKNKIEKS